MIYKAYLVRQVICFQTSTETTVEVVIEVINSFYDACLLLEYVSINYILGSLALFLKLISRACILYKVVCMVCKYVDRTLVVRVGLDCDAGFCLLQCEGCQKWLIVTVPEIPRTNFESLFSVGWLITHYSQRIRNQIGLFNSRISWQHLGLASILASVVYRKRKLEELQQ